MIEQLHFDFGSGPRRREPSTAPSPGTQPDHPDIDLPGAGRDADLEGRALGWLEQLGLGKAARSLEIHWNPRMRSSAGKAMFPTWKIDLNPRIVQWEGETIRTLKHELAHLVAYHRAGGRRIKPHGPEWKKACADLGIPGEKACHTLPLPVARRERKHRYRCPACDSEIGRVRPLRKPAACYSCCRDHSRGRYDERFQLVKV